MSAQNKRVLRRFFQEVCNDGQLARINELFASDWVGHGPQREFDNPAALMPVVAALRAASPDLQFVIEAQVAEGDLVAMRWTAHGLRRNGRAAGLTLARLACGKIVEAWTNWEMGELRPLVSTEFTPDRYHIVDKENMP